MTINFDWVKEQLAGAKVRKPVAELVINLLKKWEEVDATNVPTQEHLDQALDLFKDLVRGYAVIPEQAEEMWVSAQPGMLKSGNEVRIKHNAFTGDRGTIHNGRRGRIVAIRTSKIYVRSTDEKEPFLDGLDYNIQELDVRIR